MAPEPMFNDRTRVIKYTPGGRCRENVAEKREHLVLLAQLTEIMHDGLQ